MSLLQRLRSVLADVVRVREQEDDALTVQHDGTLASLRVVKVAEDLELVSLSQMLVWDVKPDRRFRTRVTKSAHTTMLGTVTLLDKKDHSDVMLRYNFPGTGLSDDALRTLVLMVLSSGADIRRALLA
jgi:hypothetical protein